MPSIISPIVASLASPGLDELRWLKPVRPGDRLSVQVTVLKAAPSKSKPDRGAVTSFIEVFNQAGEAGDDHEGRQHHRPAAPGVSHDSAGLTGRAAARHSAEGATNQYRDRRWRANPMRSISGAASR